MSRLEIIKNCFINDIVYYTGHAKNEMESEEFGRIYENEVFEAIQSGEIIKEYLNDKPYPSFLIFGRTKKNRPLHIVCAVNIEDNLAIAITIYEPDPKNWIEFKERKK